jgi:hypothetical protein
MFRPKNKFNGDGKASVISSDNSNGECLVVFAPCVSCDDEWILDISALFHIFCNKDWFGSYEFVQTRDFVCVCVCGR